MKTNWTVLNDNDYKTVIKCNLNILKIKYINFLKDHLFTVIGFYDYIFLVYNYYVFMFPLTEFIDVNSLEIVLVKKMIIFELF